MPKSRQSSRQGRSSSPSSTSGKKSQRQQRPRSRSATTFSALKLECSTSSAIDLSISSQFSILTGRFSELTDHRKQRSSETIQVDSYGEALFNCVVVYLNCPLHNRLALSSIEKGLFLPFAPIYSGESWLQAAASLINRLLTHNGK